MCLAMMDLSKPRKGDERMRGGEHKGTSETNKRRANVACTQERLRTVGKWAAEHKIGRKVIKGSKKEQKRGRGGQVERSSAHELGRRLHGDSHATQQVRTVRNERDLKPK